MWLNQIYYYKYTCLLFLCRNLLLVSNRKHSTPRMLAWSSSLQRQTNTVPRRHNTELSKNEVERWVPISIHFTRGRTQGLPALSCSISPVAAAVQNSCTRQLKETKCLFTELTCFVSCVVSFLCAHSSSWHSGEQNANEQNQIIVNMKRLVVKIAMQCP